MTTGFIYDARFLEHDTGPHHPERPERLASTMAHLESDPWFADLRQFDARLARTEEIESTHSIKYIRRVGRACAEGAPFIDTTDVTVSAASCDVAALAAGTPLTLGDAICNREIDNGFALIRPPGHHAETEMAMGFCLFNNVAILARYLQRVHGLNKIAIVDWDVHHGNGTQHLFEEDPSVLYVSVHQYPYYPGTGAASESGIGRGQGATLNCPLPAGATDSDYEGVFTTEILPKLSAFKPEFVIISAGFDAHLDDPLADMRLTTEFYAWMTQRLLEIADQHAAGRLLSVLEGGYHLTRLAETVAVHLEGLATGHQG